MTSTSVAGVASFTFLCLVWLSSELSPVGEEGFLLPLSWSKSCSLNAIVKNIANNCNVKVSFRKRHAGRFYTTSDDLPHGVLSIASDVQEQVSNGAWMASDFALELRQAFKLEKWGLAPEPEAVAENRNHDVSATPDADDRTVWEPVTLKGVIVSWQRQDMGVGGSDPTSGVGGSDPTSGVGGSDPTSGVGGSDPTSGFGGPSSSSGLQREPDGMPPVPKPRHQTPLVSSAEDAEARGVWAEFSMSLSQTASWLWKNQSVR